MIDSTYSASSGVLGTPLRGRVVTADSRSRTRPADRVMAKDGG